MGFEYFPSISAHDSICSAVQVRHRGDADFTDALVYAHEVQCGRKFHVICGCRVEIWLVARSFPVQHELPERQCLVCCNMHPYSCSAPYQSLASPPSHRIASLEWCERLYRCCSRVSEPIKVLSIFVQIRTLVKPMSVDFSLKH